MTKEQTVSLSASPIQDVVLPTNIIKRCLKDSSNSIPTNKVPDWDSTSAVPLLPNWADQSHSTPTILPERVSS